MTQETKSGQIATRTKEWKTIQSQIQRLSKKAQDVQMRKTGKKP
jgi:hypothetical protein